MRSQARGKKDRDGVNTSQHRDSLFSEIEASNQLREHPLLPNEGEE